MQWASASSSPNTNPNSIWHNQHKAFASILDTVDEKSAWTLKEHVWSCIYYDAFCQTILATLYKIGDLRRKNATLHLPLHKMDTEVPGTNAIVVMEPTKQNITLVGNAVARGVVSTVYLYLVGQVERAELDGLLELLAKLTRENAGAIKSIQQKNLAFVSLKRNNLIPIEILANSRPDFEKSAGVKGLASLLKLHNLNPAVFTLADSRTKAFTDELVRVASLIIQYVDNNEDKSAELNSVVLVIHRDFDVGTGLYHSWTYEGLVQEVYKVTNNKATHLSKRSFAQSDTANIQYDLDFGKDIFWQQNLAKEYQEVAEAITKEISDWKRVCVMDF